MSKIKVNPDSLKPRKEWKRHKIKEGNNIFRFLPPFGEASNGYPYRKWMVIWGLQDPENGRRRPYASSLTSDEKACPVVEYTKALTEKAKALEAELKASGASEKEVKARLAPLNKVISNVRPKGVYAWNAVDKAGVVGLVELKSTAHKKIKTLMNNYLNEMGQDPTSVNSDDDDSGIWFNVIRTGEDFNTEYDAEKVQIRQKMNGQMVYIDDRSPLPENVVTGWEDMAYDLSSIYQVKSYEELRQILLANMANIIEECPEALVEGFEPEGSIASEDDDDKPVTRAQQAKKAAAPAAQAKPVTTKFDDVDDAEEETAAPAPAAVKTKPAKASAPSDDIFAMADDILNS